MNNKSKKNKKKKSVRLIIGLTSDEISAKSQDRKRSYAKGIHKTLIVKVRTKEVCPECRSNFILRDKGLYCPKHKHVRPNNYYLDWYYEGERIRQYGYSTFKQALE